MLALTLGVLLAASPVAEPTPLTLTVGWPAVLDLRDVQAVESSDPQVVFASRLDATQVLLLAAGPGVALVRVEVGERGHTQRLEFNARVDRWAMNTPNAEHVEVEVDVEKAIELAGLQRVASGDPTLCEASLAATDRLRLFSRRPGQAALMLWIGGTDAAHRRLLVITSKGGVDRTEDDVEATLTEPLDGRLALIAGERARVPMPGTRRFESKDPSVAFATLHPSGELLVEARREGSTWVQTWTEDGTRARLWVVVNRHSAWDPRSINWLLRLEAERADEEHDRQQRAPKPAPLPSRDGEAH